MKRKKLSKWYVIVPSAIIIIAVAMVLIWLIKPAKSLDIAILDKTVPATAADGESYLGDVSNNYRKHIGLNWLTNYMKLKNPETGKLYDYTTDYYGNKIDDQANVIDNNSLTSIKNAPDVLYLGDSYGIENSDDRGIASDEMNTVSYCNSMGSTIIGEQDILTTGTDSKVSSQLQNLFGISYTGWAGRYIYDLADLTDVPYWAPDMYLKKYGVEWRCSGSGILLVSSDGDILVFEESKDFKSKNLLKISIADDYKSEFGSRSLNYYNWFELIQPTKGTETLAEYSFNFNSTGMEKFAPVSSSPVFTAVTRTATKYGGVNYYFAGDFNDFVTETKPYQFIGADLIWRLISFDKEGDVTNFYWNFYEPMMKKILKDCVAKSKDEGQQAIANNENPPRISYNSFEVYSEGKWQPFTVKGFNVNAEAPGDAKYKYSNDVSMFKKLIGEAANMGANTLRAYDLYSPEFYRALFEYNSDKNNTPIYLVQTIKTPTNVDKSSIADCLDLLDKNIEAVINAVHGTGEIDSFGERNGGVYRFDLSPYLLGYIVDTDLTVAQQNALQKSGLSAYSGTYFESKANGMEALYAQLCDYAMKYSVDTYKTLNVVLAKGNARLLDGAIWIQPNDITYNLSNITAKGAAENYFGVCFSAYMYDYPVRNYAAKLKSGHEDAYSGYLDAIHQLSDKPTVIDCFGASTAANTYDDYTDVYGLSEADQGKAIVNMHRAICSEGFAAALIADLNDSWVNVSDGSRAYTVPEQNAAIWHDVTDIGQTTGVLAVESNQPEKAELDFNTSGERMQTMKLMSSPTYLYCTITLNDEIDFDSEELVVGLDTYQRNDGEYYYDKGYFANSLSGLEYVIKFDSKNSAALYTVPSYSRKNKTVTSTESYKANYTFVSQLKYGGFSMANTQFFVTGSTVNIRIPWAMLNVTDPSRRLVIDDKTGAYKTDGQYKTTITSGVIASVLIGEKGTKDTAYIFPDSKESASYKTFKWATWESIDYTITEKDAFAQLKLYFNSLQ